MIDYNDCNDNNRYRSRRQSSLSSNSACPYASDSFCEDDDDFNDDGQYFFWDGYHVQNEIVELGDDNDDNDSRYNHERTLPQQKLPLMHPSSPSPPRADVCSDIDKNRFVLMLFNSGFSLVPTIKTFHLKLIVVQLIGNMLLLINYKEHNIQQCYRN